MSQMGRLKIFWFASKWVEEIFIVYYGAIWHLNFFFPNFHLRKDSNPEKSKRQKK